MVAEPPISFRTAGTHNPAETKIKETVEKLLLVLSEKERFIIEHRFSINVKSRKTLEAIGTHYSVTRERIRQIEKNALKKLKRNALNTNLKSIYEVAKAILKKHGGLLIETKLMNIMLVTLPHLSENELSELKLALALDSDIIKNNNTLDFEPHWRFNEVSLNTVRKITQRGYTILNKEKCVMPLSELNAKIQAEAGGEMAEATILSAMEIGKRTKFTKDGVGLKEWRHINPRTLRDKINFILEREHRPLHFDEISNKIKESNFDQKRVNVQAVHNELIRNEHFILIGRGIYALEKWGYKSGTVGDVIKEILSDGKARTRDEIMKEVLKQRQVKKITIYLNLKNNGKIKSLTDDRYQWVK